MPDRRSSRPREATAIEDPGTTQLVLFMGWIPPAVTALAGGLIVGFTTGSLWALAVVVIGGTVVGYIACLTILFTVGWFLQRLRVRSGIANAFLLVDLAAGVLAAIAVAVLASIEVDLALQATAVAVGFAVVAIVAVAVTS
jgi:hypothetical protein